MGTRSQAPDPDARHEGAASRVERALERARTPLTSAQIAEQTGLTTTAVRHHLRTMQRTGTAYATPAGSEDLRGRGRPARTWSRRYDADPHALAQVARTLASLIDTPTDVDLDEQLARIGEAVARQPGPGNDPIITGLARMGFSPRVVDDADGRTCIELDTCPFVDPADGVTDTRICRVHKLLAAGMTRDGQRIEQLQIDPRGIGCRLHVVDDGAG